jgi:hypothetical protein
VFYEGANLIYTGINTNDNLQKALEKIDAKFSNIISTVNVIAPLQKTGTINTIISIPKATTLVDGYLASTDWTIFNNKQNAIALTTTGSSGPSTFNGTSGALNIPDYSGAFSGFVPTSRTLTINGTTYDLTANRSWTIPTANIYNTDGSLTSARALTLNGFNLDFVGSVYTNRFTSSGRLLLGSTSELTYLLDVSGDGRFKGNSNAYDLLIENNAITPYPDTSVTIKSTNDTIDKGISKLILATGSKNHTIQTWGAYGVLGLRFITNNQTTNLDTSTLFVQRYTDRPTQLLLNFDRSVQVVGNITDEWIYIRAAADTNTSKAFRIVATDYTTDKFTVYGDGTTLVAGSLTANSLIKSGGTSSQFLKADGSVDSTSYISSNIYTNNGTLSGNRTVTMATNYINFIGGNIGIGSAPNAINSLQVDVANQWSGAFIGNMGGNRIPSATYGIHLGFNYTGGSGESNIVWGNAPGGVSPLPYLVFSTWDGATKTDRVEFQDTGNVVFKQYNTATSFPGTPVGHLAFDLNGNILTVASPTSTNIYNSDGVLTADRTVGTATGFKLIFNPKLEVVTTTYNVIPTMLGWWSVNGYVQTTIPASTSFSAAGYGFSSLIGNNYMTYQGSATFAADTLIGGVLGINNFAFTAAASTITITQAGGPSIRTYSAGLYQNTTSGSVNGTITHLSGLAIRPIYRTAGSCITTVTNNYGLLINDQNSYSHAIITNRWGVYQEGASDNNYFASKLLIGTTTDVASAKLVIDSTTQGFLLPRMTTTQRNSIVSPATGLIVYDNTLNSQFYYNGTAWASVGGSSVTIGTNAADVLSATAGEITADDAGSDKIVFWDDSDNKLTYLTVGDGVEINGTTITAQDWFVIAASDETSNLIAGTNKVYFRMPYAGTLLAVRASVNTAPTGSTIIVDINENGTSVLSTKLSIDATEKTSTTAAVPAVISDSALADDSEMSIDINQIGSTIPGKGLKVYLKIRRN